MNTSRKTACITGASSGIGLDFSRLLAREGYQLFLVARSEAKLRELVSAIGNATAIVADLVSPDAPRRIFAASGPVDVLINNAGFGLSGPFVETDLQKELEMIQVNIAALTHLTKLYLPAMLARNSGHILNVASTAAFLPGPLMAVYYATKAYVLSFSEALADELRDTGVTVTALCPGPTATGFAAVARMEQSRLFSLLKPMDSEKVARYGIRAMEHGKRVAIPGIANRMLTQSVRISPRRLVTTIVRKLQESR
ncbi:MAG TPA: SDR family oxidoreductase [Thermoanaerobaculia bacterium]|nr:SDR family oxidoreductase [Thermoanaerobaculia bacterium]